MAKKSLSGKPKAKSQTSESFSLINLAVQVLLKASVEKKPEG